MPNIDKLLVIPLVCQETGELFNIRIYTEGKTVQQDFNLAVIAVRPLLFNPKDKPHS